MNCRHTLDRRFMTHHFPRSFITMEFKKHRADVLLERERSLFPETMARVQNDLLQERLLAEITLVEQKRRELTNELARVRYQLYRAQHPGPQGENKKPVSVRPCTREDCRGYLDEQTGECGLCRNTTCLECNVAREKEEHVCRQEDKDTWVLIRSSSKPCPGCSARIHRISGCRQMWCPVCHSAFDYITGKMETGVIHNPHYFEYLHRTGAEAQANHHDGVVMPQGGILRLQRAVKQQPDREAWYQFYRAIAHVRHIEMPKRRDATRLPFHETTLDLRKQFMRNQLDETIYKKRIQEREKKWLKDKDLFTVMETFVEVGTDLVQSLCHEEEPDVWQVKAVQRSSLRVFFNDSVQDINFQYQSRTPVFNELFILQKTS
jgi:hypothetical protein